MTNKNSVHLQNFPDVSFIDANASLTSDMDFIRQICSAVLFIRDQKNLRVRLPLNKITIFNYGNKQQSLKNIQNSQFYQEIIKDETNVKSIEIIEIADQNRAKENEAKESKDVAEFRLQLNFKKIGAKFGQKMKEIGNEAKSGNWQRIFENGAEKIKIADVILENDDFEVKLIAKDQESSATLPNNDCVVQLDIVVTKDLEVEGMARDVIRTIQQNRKEANLNVSDRVKVGIFSQDQLLLEAVGLYNQHIREQTLANQIEIITKEESMASYPHSFSNDIEEVSARFGLIVVS